MARIDELFAIDAEARAQGLNLEARHALRQEQARPLLDMIRKQIEAARADGTAGSALGKACNYTLALWDKLTGSWNIPELELSNNLAENSMRPVALGRKNWIHIGSAQAGPKVAAILSIVESCRRLKFPVRDYLAAVFPDSLIARSSAYQTLLPRPGSPSIHRLERQGCWREGDFTTVIGTGQLQRDERHSPKKITTIQETPNPVITTDDGHPGPASLGYCHSQSKQNCDDELTRPPNPTRMIGGQNATLQTPSKRIRTRAWKHQGCRPKIQSASSDRSGGTEERCAAEAESDSTRTAENDIGHSVHRRHSGKRL